MEVLQNLEFVAFEKLVFDGETHVRGTTCFCAHFSFLETAAVRNRYDGCQTSFSEGKNAHGNVSFSTHVALKVLQFLQLKILEFSFFI